MVNVSTISGACFLVFWIGMYIYAAQSPFAGREGPISYDPLFYPNLLILGGFLLSLIVLIKGLRTKEITSKPGFRAFGVMATAGLYLLLLKQAGFMISSFVLIVVLATFSGYRKPFPLLASAAALTIVTWLVFTQLLQAPLPAFPRI